MFIAAGPLIPFRVKTAGPLNDFLPVLIVMSSRLIPSRSEKGVFLILIWHRAALGGMILCPKAFASA